MTPVQNKTTLYIDADACPVKEETYKVAGRYLLQVYVVSNSFIMTPKSPMIRRGDLPRRSPGNGRGRRGGRDAVGRVDGA